jgi:hypothetical protein
MLTFTYLQVLFITIVVLSIGFGLGFDLYGRWYDYGDINEDKKR